MRRTKNTEGITLIAIVVTIVVLLILAGVTIATLTGDNGIITRANEAKIETIKAGAKEKVQIEIIGSYGTDGKIDLETLKTNLANVGTIEETITFPVEVTVDGIKFAVEENGTSNQLILSTEDTKPYLLAGATVLEDDLSKGIVIKDKNNNEWVWIEVPKTIYSNGVTSTDYEEIYNDLNTYASTYREGKSVQGKYWPDEWYDGSNVVGYVETTIADEAAYEEAVSEGTLYINKAGIEATSGRYSSSSKYYIVNTSATLTNTDGCGLSCSKYTENYKKMLTSVYTNGGFWIGRYEAGIEGTTGAIEDDDTSISSLGRSSHTNITDESPKAISQKDAIPYNYVYCREAQKLASEMSPDTSKTSSLMFGIQWDLVCKYLEQNATELGTTPENRVAKINSNSGDWGNYSNVALTIDSNNSKQYSSPKWSAKTGEKTATTLLLSTGASTKTKVMNIYDFAGNEWEWTLERATTDIRFPCNHRGGDYKYDNSSGPASSRVCGGTTGCGSSISFRPALY